MVSKNYALQSLLPASRILHPRAAFTLVELLVVITIIGILASLITVAAIGALKRAREVEIKAELNQIDTGMMDYKNKFTAFPPNCQTDGTGTDNPLDEAGVLNDVRRHIKQVASRSQEPDALIAGLAGLRPNGTQLTGGGPGLPGGMTAGEAVVFWLGGFSSDPKYPISGEGGPSYLASEGNRDPIDNRAWIFPFDVGRLGPRDDEGYFDESRGRFIEYPDPRDPTNTAKRRRINFWQYTPRKSEQPYLYFDTSRHPAAVPVSGEIRGPFDPPAATGLSGLALHVHALKKLNPTYTASQAGSVSPIEFIDTEKFQVLHCGLDEAWDEESFERMSAHGVSELGSPQDAKYPENYLLFPTGPFAGECADTIANFASETKIEDAAE